MVDTFRPLELGEAGRAVEDPAYAWTWSGRGPSADTTGDGGPALYSNS
jgi:homogentisate 1,2-dioxygenase